MDPVIVTEKLSRRFGDLWAVRDLNLVVERGQVFGFLGPNGAGKTTSVRLLTGILEPSDGKATVLGMNVLDHAAEIRQQSGVLTENPSVYEALTARENLRFFGDTFRVPADKLDDRIDDLLEQFGLSERADAKVGTYSRGMKQRLAIARALLHEPALLFLDEPTAGLDPAASRSVIELIEALSRDKGHTIFMCTHNLTEAQRLCDLVGVIDQGTLRAIGSPQELARQIWQNTLVEIDLRGAPSQAVIQAIEQQPMTVSLSVDGNLIIEVKDSRAIPDIVRAIVQAEGQVYGVRQRDYSLEDIYFELQNSKAAVEMREDQG